jgi:acetate---CoA ligase (ADP-forming)
LDASRPVEPLAVVRETPLRFTAGAALAARSGPLNEAESKLLLAQFGIPCVRERVARDSREAEAIARGGDAKLVLKILSRHIAHKTEIGGVALDVSPNDVARRCDEMSAAVARLSPHPLEGFLLQEPVENGIEVILGFHRDPQLGPAILLGTGGIAVEIFDDTVIRLPPVDRPAGQAMIGELKGAKLLRGFRGRPHHDIDALASAIAAFSDMVAVLGDRLVEAEINPLFVLREGQGVRAADAAITLR